MTSLIINLPHLQSRRQRRGALLLSLLCWAWFVMPLVIVGGWLLGFHVLAQEVVWLGGWQALVRLAGSAAAIIMALTAAWTLWTLSEIRHARRFRPMAPVAAAIGFAVDPALVGEARDVLVTTIWFAADGTIAAIVPDGPKALDQRRAA